MHTHYDSRQQSLENPASTFNIDTTIHIHDSLQWRFQVMLVKENINASTFLTIIMPNEYLFGKLIIELSNLKRQEELE